MLACFSALFFLTAHSVLRLLPLRRTGWVPRQGALLIGLLSLVLLILQVGANPPVVRAAMMTGGVAILFSTVKADPLVAFVCRCNASGDCGSS